MDMRLKLNLKTVRSVAIALSLIIAGYSLGHYRGQKQLINQGSLDLGLPKKVVNTNAPAEYKEIDFSLFWEVWQKMERDYLDPEEIDPEKMVYGAISGMVSAVGDPYTVFLPPVEQKRATEDLAGAFKGVGIQLGYRDQQLAVVAPLKGMPAEAQGVEAGDLILNIKDDDKGIDIDTNGMTLPEAVNHIRGEGGKPVTLTLYRESKGAPFDVTIVRDTIVVPSVELSFVPADGLKEGEEAEDNGSFPAGSVAHLTLSRFGERTNSEWDDAVDEIVRRSDLKGVVLDVRNNPGGFLTGSIYVASEFLDGGVVVKQQGRYDSQTYSVNRKGRLIGTPLSILINQGSASASEIVSGALRDRLEAPLVGVRSFGKGTVQSTQDLRGGTGIHITTARWLLPNGGWIHKEGLEPDVEATNSAETSFDDMLDAGIKAL